MLEKEKEKEINITNIDSLDDEWIKKFEEEDKKYEDFYKEDNYYVNNNFIYLEVLIKCNFSIFI